MCCPLVLPNVRQAANSGLESDLQGILADPQSCGQTTLSPDESVIPHVCDGGADEEVDFASLQVALAVAMAAAVLQ